MKWCLNRSRLLKKSIALERGLIRTILFLPRTHLRKILPQNRLPTENYITSEVAALPARRVFQQSRSVLTPSNHGRSTPSPTFFDRGSPKAEATGSNPVGCTKHIKDLDYSGLHLPSAGHHGGSTLPSAPPYNGTLFAFSNGSEFLKPLFRRLKIVRVGQP